MLLRHCITWNTLSSLSQCRFSLGQGLFSSLLVTSWLLTKSVNVFCHSLNWLLERLAVSGRLCKAIFNWRSFHWLWNLLVNLSLWLLLLLLRNDISNWLLLNNLHWLVVNWCLHELLDLLNRLLNISLLRSRLNNLLFWQSWLRFSNNLSWSFSGVFQLNWLFVLKILIDLICDLLGEESISISVLFPFSCWELFLVVT